MNVGNLFASIALDITKFTSGLKKAQSAAAQAAGSMQSYFNQSSNAINNVGNSAKNASNNFKDLQRVVSGILIAQAFYRGLNAIENATTAVVNFSNNMRIAGVAMEYFIGSKEGAESFLAVMKDFAATTPFTTEQAVSMSRKLMAMGFQAESVKSVLTIMTDAASATGGTAEQMDRVVLALGQMKTNGFIAGQELRQLAEAGIPIYKILQEELGLTLDQLRKIGDYKISGDLGVAATLKGLEKRYKGASAKIAELIPGMMSTIKDDSLIISEAMFKGPYNALEDFIRRIKNSFEYARDIISKSGIGGLFKNIVPAELQTSIKSIMAGFKSLGSAISDLVKALTPLAQMIGATLIRVLGIVVPIVATVARGIAYLASVLMNTSPAVKVFAQAIIGLLVANYVARSILFLWKVIGLGSICTFVADSVLLLSKAVQFLFLVFAKNPLVAVISIVAAALLALALSSKTVSAWLDNLMTKLSALAGTKLSGILNPEDNQKLLEGTEQFNGVLKDMNKDLTKVGESAKKSGKKVKEKFVASFDELYQIPDLLDKTNEALNGTTNMNFKTPNIKVPDLKVSTPSVENPLKDGFFIPELRNPKKPETPPNIPPPDTSPVTSAINTVEAAIANMKQVLQPAFTAVSNWCTDISSLFSNLGVSITNWSNNTVNTIYNWTISTSSNFANWSANTSYLFTNWVYNTSSLLTNWVIQSADSLSNWTTQTINSLLNWSSNTAASISAWSNNTASKFSTWYSSTTATIGAWYNSTSSTFTSWVSSVYNNISTWSSSTANNIVTWSSNTAGNITTWASNVASSIASWASVTSSNINSWVSNTKSNIGTWIANTASGIGSWTSNTANNIANWATSTSSNFASWANNVMGNVAMTATNIMSNINNALSNTWDNISSWVSATSGGFASWASNLANTVGSAASNMAKNIGNGLQAAWSSLTSFAKAAGTAVSGWWDDNKAVVVPVTLAAAGVGLATAAIISGGTLAPAAVAGMAALASVPAMNTASMNQLATGGIVDKDQIIRIGEGNKREVVIPLENSSYMRPFSAAVANDLFNMQNKNTTTNNSTDDRPILCVGTLIANDQSLRELERRMQVIRVQENNRLVKA